jgi:hypothetical protein
LNGLCGAGEKDSVFVLESHAPYWSLHKIDALGNLKKEEKEQGVVHKTTGNKRHSLSIITIKPNCNKKDSDQKPNAGCRMLQLKTYRG